MAPLLDYAAIFRFLDDTSRIHRRQFQQPDDALPITFNTLVAREDGDSQNPKYHPGLGTKDPNTFNNNGFFALFALIGAAMVVASIWFFFWAKNGGFVWKQGDWDDYKSTVLRRKGKDGKTLSNATKTTDLGQKSIAGTFDIDHREEMAEVRDYAFQDPNRNERPGKHKRREPSDEDLRAYRHERPARVGGLNREQDGSQFDLSSTDRSDAASNSDNSLRPLKKQQDGSTPRRQTLGNKKRERKQERSHMQDGQAAREPKTRHASNPTPGQSFPAQDHSRRGESVRAEAPRYPAMAHAARHESPLRHSSPRQNNNGAPSRSPRATPRSHRQSQPAQPPLPQPPGSWDAYSDASSDTGTKSYEHHIPGLSRGGVGRTGGFRRDYGGQRDSLYDSEDLGTTRY